MAVYVAMWSINESRTDNTSTSERMMERLAIVEHRRNPTLDNVAWITTYLTADDLHTFLRAALHEEDALFVCRLKKGEYQGWLKADTWYWIDAAS